MTRSPTAIQHGSYDRRSLRPRILHLGFGAFARAHTLLYTDLALDSAPSDWGVVVARLNSGAGQLSDLDQADHSYFVVETSDQGIAARQIGCISGTLHPARDGQDALAELIATPDLAVITLTITEKGYCLSGQDLDLNLPDVAHDLAHPESPKTAIGTLVEGLRHRKAAGRGGVTILSCDNLPANGQASRRAVLAMARAQDPGLAHWIDTTCTFPCSMVDRIVPAMTQASHAQLTELLGQPDPNGILCEPFRQWVIEDNFAAGRPDWHMAGAEFVTDVAPFEEMKLRMLNGAHSFLAYLGSLAGHETVDACMKDDVFRTAASRLMLAEQAPTLRVPEDVDLTAYADRLIDRFSNSHLHHKTIQIAADGSQKLPQRLLAPIADHLNDGTPWPLSALAVAGWMRFLRGESEGGAPLVVNDPMVEDLTRHAAGPDTAACVDSLLGMTSIFPSELATNPAFRTGILSACQTLSDIGVRAALNRALQTEETQP